MSLRHLIRDLNGMGIYPDVFISMSDPIMKSGKVFSRHGKLNKYYCRVIIKGNTLYGFDRKVMITSTPNEIIASSQSCSVKMINVGIDGIDLEHDGRTVYVPYNYHQISRDVYGILLRLVYVHGNDIDSMRDEILKLQPKYICKYCNGARLTFMTTYRVFAYHCESSFINCYNCGRFYEVI